VGEHFVEAFVDDVSLGVAAVHGTGPMDVTALFGGAEIDMLEITAVADGIRISTVSYDLAPDYWIRVWMSHLAPATMSDFTHCGLTFNGSPGALALDGGLGVVGVENGWIDPGEVLSVELDEPLSWICYELNGIDSNGNGEVGNHFVEAFDALGESLGIRSATSEGRVYLEQLFGGVPIGRFELTAVDRIQLDVVHLIPEPAGAAGAALLACAARRRRRGRY
jgi:hypothetical protein